MRSFLALGLLLALGTSADAAKARHAKLRVDHFRPAQPAAVPKGITVPGWTAEQTQNWLNSYGYGTD